MAPTGDEFSSPGSVTYDSETMVVGDGTWDFSKNTFLLPNLEGFNFDTMRYNGMGNRFSTLTQYHSIILAHGILAALVFLLFVPTAIFVVRFHTGRPGFAVRFHARLQIVSSLLLIVVFILGFLAVGPSRALSNPHHGIGVAIFVVFVLQFVGGRIIYRIQKAHSLRVTLHQWGGRTIALLGMIQIPLGLTLYGAPKYLFIMYAVWMAFLLLVYFILNFRAGSRRELLIEPTRSEIGRSEIGGARSEARTRVTDSEYFSEHRDDGHNKWKWLGPLAAGGAAWWWKKGRDKGSRGRSRTPSPSGRSRGPEVVPSRRGSASYYESDKYTDVSPQRKSGGGGGGMMRALGGAAALFGAGKLFNNHMDKRRGGYDDEYSAVSTETPRRYPPGRGIPPSDLSSEFTEDIRGDPTATSLLSPPPGERAAMAGALGAADSRVGSQRHGHPRGPPPARRSGGRRSFDDSEYSSYVSPSRRPVDAEGSRGGGTGKGILGGIGLGWIGKKMADRKARKEEQRRLDEEDDMRSGLTDSRYTGDGYPSPTRKPARRPTVRRPTGYPPPSAPTEMTESSILTEEPSTVAPMPPRASGPSSHARSRSRSQRNIAPVAMPAMPPDHSETESSYVSDARPRRRESSKRRKEGERASAAAAARASELAAEQDVERERYGSPHSNPVSVKLKMHDDRDRNVTLRRLTEEEARAARGRSRADSESNLSEYDSPSQGRTRYRRDSSHRRAESAAERRVESDRDTLAPLSPPNPAFAKGRRNKDSAYYSGAQPGPSGTSAAAGQTVSSLGSLASPESHGTWSQMSPSPSGPPAVEKPGPGSAADNRRRRRQERRRGSSTQPSAADMFD
ncbi:uncharacterized protein J7T54_007928 [Emericellopsis cladophorae]|uniref:Cytochrome b561 domain-containing protein n=1 Tax=Emericellopsis cladophorae TaxID=2686198 RepID=A0A9Q0BHV1_9HYPO|nr:uncharacterized protein J7T54_007928 [Emericellopsis cladophorae]KAI6784834.1 hypothetical protein J7T54_007928 [Emericellopsis cladophorae]